MMNWINQLLSKVRGLQKIPGEDAYESYLAHWQSCHQQAEEKPLDRKAFFKKELERKWNGVNRCC